MVSTPVPPSSFHAADLPPTLAVHSGNPLPSSPKLAVAMWQSSGSFQKPTLDPVFWPPSVPSPTPVPLLRKVNVTLLFGSPVPHGWLVLQAWSPAGGSMGK